MDVLAQAQRISQVLGNPVALYSRHPSSSTGVCPFYWVPGLCLVKRVFLIAGDTVPADVSARLKVSYKRGVTVTDLYNAIIPGWSALTKVSLATPGAQLQADDILLVQVTPAPAVALPELLVGVELQLN